MKIPPREIEKFINNIPVKTKAILLYGPDLGLINIRVLQITKSRNLVAKFNYDQIKNSPELLLDELNSNSLFSSNKMEKVIIIECNGSIFSENLNKILKELNFEGLLLFQGTDLGTDSPLRKFFENNNNIAAVACYHDDEANIAVLVQQIFKKNNKVLTSAVLKILVNSITHGDRMLITNEIEKICLFLGDKKNIIEEDLEKYLESEGEVNFDKLCFKMSLKEVNNLETLLIKLQNEGHNLISISRMLSRHFYRLYQVKKIINTGQTEQQAMNSLFPPVFFKQTNNFTKSLKLWSEKELLEFLKQLNQFELMAKKDSATGELILKNMMVRING